MDVRLPRLGEGADSGTVSSLFVKEGDLVKKDQPVLELESEKAVASIPSPAPGRISKILVKDGDQIKVGQVIFVLSTDETVTSTPPPAARAIDATVGDEGPGEVSVESAGTIPTNGKHVLSAPPLEEPLPPPPAGTPPAASPTVRKLARDLGIDLSRVRGSERGGRIVVADIKRYVQRLQQLASAPKTTPAKPGAPALPAAEPIDFSAWGPVHTKKASVLRRTISNKMTESWTTVPHVTQFDEADLTAILGLRKKFGPRFEKKKGHLTLTPFVLKAVAAALKVHPLLNASYDPATDEIVFKDYYHLGIAVDTEQGLIVPVLRNVDRKSMLELSVELADLADRTRQRKVSLEEMRGATFTISNQGGIGSGHFTPIINTPQVAILGLGRGVVKPVVRKGKITQRTMVPLGLSYDHRLVDGADAARFMVELVQVLENFKEADVTL